MLWGLFLVALVLSASGCWMFSKANAIRQFSNVSPVDNRWHKQVTPGLGGVPIYTALGLTLIAFSVTTSPTVFFLIAFSAPLLLAGTYDDLKPVPPSIKLIIQILSTGVFVLFALSFPGMNILTNIIGEDPQNIINQAEYSLGFCLLSVIWLVGIINAINLLDNMDGLSGGVAFIACVTLVLLLKQSSSYAHIAVLYMALAGALAGFLILNINPAKLFMGDAGSLWIGFLVGVGALITILEPASTNVWILPMVVCTVPIADTLMVMITRRLRGQSVSIGGQDHLSHRLVSLGLSQRVSVAILWLAAILASALALLIQAQPMAIWALPVSVYYVVIIAAVVWLSQATSAPNGIAMKNASTSHSSV